MSGVPSAFHFLVLGLAAWSTFYLIGQDDITEKIRRRLLRLGEEWEKEGDPYPDDYHFGVGKFITCPYCAGFWIWVAWYLAWWIWPAVVLPAAFIMAGRTIVIAVQKILRKDEDKEASNDALAISGALRDIARKQVVRTRP